MTAMTTRIAQLTLDVIDPAKMAEFWSLALGYRVVPDDGQSIHLVPPDDEDAAAPTMWLQPVDEPKLRKNRCHPDLEATDPQQEVERLIALGASHAEIGQTGHEGFVVLVDPEGNEFCVLDAPLEPTAELS
jgi:catechol 2,3-dioxygenase-like lactoylglutathione lyase family enzyme